MSVGGGLRVGHHRDAVDGRRQDHRAASASTTSRGVARSRGADASGVALADGAAVAAPRARRSRSTRPADAAAGRRRHAGQPRATASQEPIGGARPASRELEPHDREPRVVDDARRSRPPPRTRAWPRSSRRVGPSPPGRPRRRRTRASARSSQTAATRRRPSPVPRAAAVVAMQVITAGSGESGQLRIEVARPLRPRVGGQRTELAVRGRLAVARQDLRVATRSPRARGSAARACAARRGPIGGGRPRGRARTGSGRRPRRRRGTGCGSTASAARRTG